MASEINSPNNILDILDGKIKWYKLAWILPGDTNDKKLKLNITISDVPLMKKLKKQNWLNSKFDTENWNGAPLPLMRKCEGVEIVPMYHSWIKLNWTVDNVKFYEVYHTDYLYQVQSLEF